MTETIFIVGQIFEGMYPPEAADWCNKNRAYIQELERNEENVRRFQIVSYPEPTVDELKISTIPLVDSMTSEDILSGFEYEVNGEILHFSYDSFDQQNFADTANVATLSLSGVKGLPTSITWNGYRNYTPETGGELVRINLDVTEYLALYTQGALVHKATKMEEGGKRKAQIEASTSTEEINNLLKEWNI